MNNHQHIRREMLRRSIYALLAPIYLTLAVLACTGQLANMQINDEPVYVCPTSTPRPTHTPRPTDTQPDVYIPPSGWVPEYEEECEWVWNGYAYVERCEWVEDGGHWENPGHYVPGATSTPRPTHTPYPTPTPYIVTENYAMGADVHVGDRSTLALRLRVERPQTIPVDTETQVVRWEVRVRNIGAVPYNTLPGAQVFVSEVGGVSGKWLHR